MGKTGRPGGRARRIATHRSLGELRRNPAMPQVRAPQSSPATSRHFVGGNAQAERAPTSADAPTLNPRSRVEVPQNEDRGPSPRRQDLGDALVFQAPAPPARRATTKSTRAPMPLRTDEKNPGIRRM